MSRPNVADWQYLGVDKFTLGLEWNCGRMARKGHICEDTFAYGSYIVRISRGLIFIPRLHKSRPSQPLLSEEFCHQLHVGDSFHADVYIFHMI